MTLLFDYRYKAPSFAKHIEEILHPDSKITRGLNKRSKNICFADNAIASLPP